MESTTPPNPYSAPAANLYGSSSGTGADIVAPSTVAALAGTKGWVRFMSVVMWLACVGLGLLSGVYAVIAFAGASEFANNPAFRGNPAFPGGANFIAATLIGTSVYFGLLAILFIYPALKLWKYANRISNLMATRTTADLDSALGQQRGYWKFQGIMVIIMICFVVIGIIALMALGMSAAMRVPR